MRKGPKHTGRRMAAQMHALAAVQRDILPRDSAWGRKYLREFNQAFAKYESALTSEEVTARLADADIVLVGDYHALPKSQQFAAQLVENLAQSGPVVLGVEAILSRDQRIVDAWWKREIEEAELRRRLRFDRDWGYEWAPFYELLVAAREHCQAIYGLDCMPREDLRRIRSRDRHAVAKIREMRERHPVSTLVVHFGESHMAPEHLPGLLRDAMPEERLLTILQNVDRLYWKATEQGAEAVNLGPNEICVFNSSPLEKYESYRLCLERWNGEEQPDFAPAVYNLIFSLARTLGFRLDSPHNGTQPKYLADALPEVVDVKEEDLGAQFEEQGCRYDGTTNTFFIHEFKMPGAAAEATRFLHQACCGMKGSRGEEALVQFGARLLSPGTQTGTSVEGEELYLAYLDGRVTRSQLRRMFLGRSE